MYVIKKDVVRGGYYVQKIGGKIVFYGTKTECEEWIERNGHDGDC